MRLRLTDNLSAALTELMEVSVYLDVNIWKSPHYFYKEQCFLNVNLSRYQINDRIVDTLKDFK